MNTITLSNQHSNSILGDRRPAGSAWQLVVDEVSAFIGVIFSPRRIRAGIEQIVALHREAARLDGTDPTRAAALRARAARVEL